MFVSHPYVFFGEMSVRFFGPFFDWVIYFSGIELRSCLYIFEINSLSVASLAIIFSHSEGCLFTLLFTFLRCVKTFKFNEVPFVYFCFYFHYSERWVIEDPAVIYIRECFAYVFL